MLLQAGTFYDYRQRSLRI